MGTQAFKVSIPSPCNEAWKDMTPVEGGRHCASCQKRVVDFTQLTNRQVLNLISKPDDNLCGRLSASQLDAIYTSKSVGRPIFWKLAFTTLLYILNTFSLRAQNTKIKTSTRSISGQVVDDSTGAFVPCAIVTYKVLGKTEGTIVDENGNYSLQIPSKAFVNNQLKLNYSALGYGKQTETINKSSTQYPIQLVTTIKAQLGTPTIKSYRRTMVDYMGVISVATPPHRSRIRRFFDKIF